MRRPVVNKDPSWRRRDDSAPVAVAQSVVSREAHICQKVADRNGSAWLASWKVAAGGDGSWEGGCWLLVCLHSRLSSLQVEADRKHLT